MSNYVSDIDFHSYYDWCGGWCINLESVRVHNVMVILEKDGEKWFWEITTFQTKDDECYGSAKERNRDITFPWIKIEELNLKYKDVTYFKN